MARKSTSHPSTADTAAYSASQPLFDAIRNASDHIEEQKQHLAAAKDVVQQLHVKVPNEHIGVNTVTRADYIECLVRGWRLVTNSYERIFAELCTLTAPDPATGREAQDDYATFKRIHESALAANTKTFRYSTGTPTEKRKVREAHAIGDDNALESPTPAKKAKVDRKVKEATTTTLMPTKRTATEATSPEPAARPSKRQRTTELSSTTTAQATEPDSKQAKRERRRARAAEQKRAQASAPKTVPTTLQPTSPAAHIAELEPEPQVHYEDVTAEVDARLAAKEEKKRLKRDAKKRKRDSFGSAVVEAEVGQEQAALEARDRELAAKPAKKRSKSATGEAVRTGGVELPERGKRRGEHASGDVDVGGNGAMEGEGRKKRKKKKSSD